MRRENLLDDDVARFPRPAGRALQAPGVLQRIEQDIDVIHAQTINASVLDQAQQAAMRFVEQVDAFHAQTAQGVDVEEAAVVDLVRRNPPIRQSVGLGVEQPPQRPPAIRHSGLTSKCAQRGLHFLGDRGLLAHRGCELLRQFVGA